MSGGQLTFDLDVGRCEHGGCSKRRTHRAVSRWVRGPADAPETGIAMRECCEAHANYFARAWCGWVLYPAVRDVVWMERIG